MSKPSKRSFVIYAIFSSTKTAFIGKSFGSLGPTHSRHVHGKNKYTRDHLSKSALNGEIPRLSILQRLEEVDFREAYAHLLAWVRLFWTHGYYLAMQNGVIDDALHMHPRTEHLYNLIKDEHLEHLLQQETCFPRKGLRKKKTATAIPNHSKSVQFNMRVRQQDKDAYNEMCNRELLSKKDMFSLLVRSMDEKSTFEDTRISMLKQRIEKESKELEIAHNRIERLYNFVQHDKRYKNTVAIVNQMWNTYIHSMSAIDHSGDYDVHDIMRAKYSDYSPNEFSYPDECSGVTEFVLLGLVYMKSASGIFVLGRTLDGKRIKLRSFPKKDYIGTIIPRSKWSFFGSKWIVAWNTASDGAKDLVGSFYVPLSLDSMRAEDFDIVEHYNSVDALIRKADVEKR